MTKSKSKSKSITKLNRPSVCWLHQINKVADYVRCKVKLNTSPLNSIGLPCSSLI